MIRIFSLLVLVLVSAALRAGDANDIPLAPAVECTPRSGLPNFFAKLEVGKDVKIAYFGGSITAQEGWRPKTLKYFQTQYPKATVSQINAAIGGTGSDLGVFRLKQDVLDKQPDLVFVEFAVNDGGATPVQIYRCMEGIVRQIWKTNPNCDICYVYTLVEGMAPTIQEGHFQRSASAMEKIATHYGIPSIHMGIEVCKLAKEGKLIFKGKLPKTDEEKKEVGDKIIFSPDSVHPFPETGHELYLQSIVRSLPAIKDANKVPAPHAIPEAFVADNYERAQMIAIDKAKLSPEFETLYPNTNKIMKNFGNRLGALRKAEKPGATLTFKFKGTRASVYDVFGPDGGQVAITLDAQAPRTIPRFDSYSTYHRLGAFVIGSELPDAEHTVKIELLPGQPDKAKILSQRNEKMDDPKRFDGTAFYPGALLIVGELVE